MYEIFTSSLLFIATHCLLLTCSSPLLQEDYEFRVSGGSDAMEGEIPWQVSLHGDNTSYHCGGVIISEDYILTAASCALWDLQTVEAGSIYLSEPFYIHQALFLFVHPEFNYSSNPDPTFIQEHNIAILRVSPSFEFGEFLSPCKLPEVEIGTAPGTKAVVSGWGQTVWSGETSDVLQKAEVTVASRKECEETYANAGVTHGMLCTKPGRNNENACIGDAGGPLTVNGELRGIVSYGYGCTQLIERPALYTDLAFYRTWIYETTGV